MHVIFASLCIRYHEIRIPKSLNSHVIRNTPLIPERNLESGFTLIARTRQQPIYKSEPVE